MLLCKYQDKSGSIFEESVKDDEFFSFAARVSDLALASNCVKVVASGLWLERIRKHFSNLPFMETGVYAPTIAWYGDHAKFIAGNIADVCSAYFQFWSGDSLQSEASKPDRQTLGQAIDLYHAFAVKKLTRIREILDDHSINDLERNVKIKEVLEW